MTPMAELVRGGALGVGAISQSTAAACCTRPRRMACFDDLPMLKLKGFARARYYRHAGPEAAQ